MLEVFKQRILKLLRSREYRPVKLAQLARTLGVSDEDYGEFKKAFEQLRKSGHVIIGSGNVVTLPLLSSRVIGTFRANPKGFGFVVPLEANVHGDLFVGPEDTAGAMTGDIVSARVAKKGRRAGQTRYAGKITDILARASNRFVGTLAKEKSGWFVQPDGSAFTELISVDDVGAKGAKEKDKVVVEILSYPTTDYLARGVIIEVLGKAGRYDSETESIIRQYHLPDAFDEPCLEQARRAAEAFDLTSVTDRVDLSDKVIITIDPPDAKDFDDAVSLEKDSEGNWVLGVHIADVSHFVSADSALDNEARNRGNSVYLPQKTLPMLPEILSNGICSLQPEQKRFTKSVLITYDQKGKVLSRKFANSIIRSSARLTYQQADQMLKGHTKDFKDKVIGLLKDMEKLSRIIERRRESQGMLHLDLPETELVFNEAGQVIEALPADDSYPHTIIEMFMVEANEAVASLLDGKNIRFMRRIHPEPDALSLKNLAKLLRALGLSISRNPDRFALQGLLEAVKGGDCSFAVNMAVLRSLEKAVYSPAEIGHFALASKDYCHFTSPIRRYADLLVHRLLDAHLKGGSAPLEGGLTEIGKHITFTEQRAEDAEEELKTVLILQMLKGRIGDELDCVITGVAAFGVFARCLKFGIEGLIPIEQLGPDNWQFNQRAYCITGIRSGYTVGLGHRLKTRIISINVSARQLNLAPAQPLTKSRAKPKLERRKKHPRKRAPGRRFR